MPAVPSTSRALPAGPLRAALRAGRLLAPLLLVALLVPASAGAKGTLYVSNFGSDNLSAFSLAGDGLPARIPGSPFPAGDGSSGVAITPDASHLYVGSSFGFDLHAFSLDAATGVPTPIAGSPFPTTGLNFAAIAPDGRRAYFTDSFDETVQGFSLAASGAVAPLPPVPTDANPEGLAISPDGRFLYVADDGADSVSAYAIAANGSLSPLPGSPQPAGDGPVELAVSPGGEHLYVTNVYSNEISAYAIAADGSLSPLPGSPFTGVRGPQDVAITPDGKHLYTTSLFYGVYAFDVYADGSLAPVGGSPFADRTPVGDYRPAGIAISPDGRRAYVANSMTNDLSTFAIAADGSLSPLAGSPTPSGGIGAGAFSLAIPPDQGPRAVLSAAPAGDLSARLDASGSSDPDGAVAAYEWSFGDGTFSRGASPSLVHAYPRPGTYAVTVRAIDDEGCSATFVFTGQTAYCNGSPAATASAEVTVAAAVPDNTVVGIRVRARKRQRQRRASRGRIAVELKAGAAEAVRIVAGGKIVVAKHGRAKRTSVPLKQVRRSAPAGKLKKLTLRPRTRKAALRVAAALRGGARVTARVRLRFTDGAGARATRSRTIRLR
jgi:DNA-binding beta-propeller fold protein YncE